MLGVVRQIMRFLGPYAKRIRLAWVFAFLRALCANAPFMVAVVLVNQLMEGTLDAGGCVVAAFVMVAFLVLQSLFQHAADRLQSTAGFELFADKRLELAEHLRRLPMGYFTQGNLGRISSVLSADMVFIEEHAMMVLADIASNVFAQAIITVFMFVLNLLVGAVVLATEAVAALVARPMNREALGHSRERQQVVEDLTSSLLEYVGGLHIVKSFNIAGAGATELRDAFARTSAANIAFEEGHAPWLRRLLIVYALGTSAVVALSVWLLQTGALAPGMFIGVMLFAFNLFAPTRALYQLDSQITIMQACLDRLQVIFDEPEINDSAVQPNGETGDAAASAGTQDDELTYVILSERSESKNLNVASGDPSTSALRAYAQDDKESAPSECGAQDGIEDVENLAAAPEIEFRDVCFGYGADEVIHDVSFAVERGQTVALVGQSGSGKSTLANLLARFWDVDGGAVLLRGTDIRDLPLATLMDNLSMVFQRVYLFEDTVASNIRLGRPDATDEEVRDAAAKARALDFIESMPYGFNTRIGEGGATLSGGEAQRISIARAILKDAPIVVLDEATAFADPENEALIQKAFASLTQGRTVIMIAHRLSTVVGADKIIVLNEGHVEEEGTHEELLKNNGMYARMWADYNQAVQWKIGGAQ